MSWSVASATVPPGTAWTHGTGKPITVQPRVSNPHFINSEVEIRILSVNGEHLLLWPAPSMSGQKPVWKPDSQSRDPACGQAGVQANVSEKRRGGFAPPEMYRCRPSGDGSERCQRQLWSDASRRIVVHARQNMDRTQSLTPVRAEARPHPHAPMVHRCRIGGSAPRAGR